MTDIEINGYSVSLDRLLEGQQAVDKINEQRQEVRRNAHHRALCRIAAAQWIIDNPIMSAHYRQERLA